MKYFILFFLFLISLTSCDPNGQPKQGRPNDLDTTGTILQQWKETDEGFNGTISLIKKGDTLKMVSTYEKSKHITQREILIDLLQEDNSGELVRYNFDNKHGEYYQIEKSGNLRVYNDTNFFKEYVLIKTP